MTAYTTGQRQTISQQVQEAREKRRQILEAVYGRRKVIYSKFYKKMQLQSKDAIAAAAEIVRKTDTLIFGNGDIRSLYEAAQRIRTTGVHGVLIGRASFGNPWIFRKRDRLKKLIKAGINPTVEDLADEMPSREERLLMALEHAHVHAKLKGEDHYVEMRKHMGWYLGHFPGAKQVRNALVRINSLADVERIIHAALDNPDAFKEEEAEALQEDVCASELDLSCAC